jgi:hypothetical protein
METTHPQYPSLSTHTAFACVGDPTPALHDYDLPRMARAWRGEASGGAHILEESVVMQVWTRGSVLVRLNSKLCAMLSSFLVATLQASSYPSATLRGWMPLSSSPCTQLPVCRPQQLSFWPDT